MLTQDDLKAKLEKEIPNFYHALITDTSNGCGQSFDVVVVSDVFVGKNKLSRCRIVNKALAEEVAQIHAFGCKCYTTNEWNEILGN
ncbi:Bol2p [Kluyveromyces lactis]|uniref:KLLA0A01551p n=1 Tax=Kluyveromyces lactis (strain ATCC 8585 / CBS 2359 / DSM 70799 / NBRC 1267 / NRRL Y-1140 / WM37) TaxID=284590 RepID=Q6CYC2_KLULA|nr:uncharacterized protein KLLA0_A01551g [Kluyveromyces lactis]CAH02655.1 KLLA0A01551p [Kluyveromyces lactis]|eukprot:XP_451067.1 uncharacterized protein KLLA0_A01551g [Kluyveromyces lactis]